MTAVTINRDPVYVTKIQDNCKDKGICKTECLYCGLRFDIWQKSKRRHDCNNKIITGNHHLFVERNRQQK